jgi:uncharacterized YigZ family protein
MENTNSHIKDSYLSIPFTARGLYKNKGSRFLSWAYPVETEESVKAILKDLRKEYHDARHHCYAYRLGWQGEQYRANDDGEPSSSAGRPILGQIDSRGLSDVLVVVVRYFGGIKLGIPGLIKAYKTAAAEALDEAGKVEKIAGKWFRISFDYPAMNPVMTVLKDLALEQRNQQFGVQCSLEARIRLSEERKFLDSLALIDIDVLEEL